MWELDGESYRRLWSSYELIEVIQVGVKRLIGMSRATP